MATYTCNSGFSLSGVTTRTCEAEGWSAEAPTCERKQQWKTHDISYVLICIVCGVTHFLSTGDIDCGPLDDPDNGRVELTGTTEDSTASYFCFSGFELKGAQVRICTASGWSETEPTCERKLQ